MKTTSFSIRTKARVEIVSITDRINEALSELGSAEGIYFLEFDGPRTREVRIYLP